MPLFALSFLYFSALTAFQLAFDYTTSIVPLMGMVTVLKVCSASINCNSTVEVDLCAGVEDPDFCIFFFAFFF